MEQEMRLERARRTSLGARATRCLTIIGVASAISVSGPAAAQQQVPSPAGVFAEQAQKLGVKKCANLFAGMGSGLTNGSQFTVKAMANQPSPDTHPVQGVVGMTYDTSAYKGKAAGILFAAPSGETCQGSLVRIAPYQQSCAEVVRILPEGTKEEETLSGVPMYHLGGNQGAALLVESGSSCVVVTIAQSSAS